MCCVGTLLVNERMLESYIIARDRFLVPNGKMFPSRGRYVLFLRTLHFYHLNVFFLVLDLKGLLNRLC